MLDTGNTLSKFWKNYSKIYFLGSNSEEGTPVPIPNTEVKLFSADDSECKNRTPPRIFFLQFFKIPIGIFFSFVEIYT